MPTAAEKISLETFRAQYANEKPYFELLNGEPVRKAMPTKLHSSLQVALVFVLTLLGFKAKTELTLAIDPEWEPVPDVSGIVGASESPYPTKPVALAVEILSPSDRFSSVVGKCRRYSAWGIPDILVFDPAEREGWYWDITSNEMRLIRGSYRFRSLPAELVLADLWQRFDLELEPSS